MSGKLLTLMQAWRKGEAEHGPVRGLLLYGDVLDYVQECERQARLDEHKILAGLDEEGKKQRYLELARE